MSASKAQNSQSTSTLILDRLAIKKELSEKGEYNKDSIQIKNFENPLKAEGALNKIADETFLAKISAENSTYKGMLNEKLQRESYGYNKYDNGDIYLGQFSQDKRNSRGIYLWAPQVANSRSKKELYIGNWKNDEKEGSGIYYWMDEKKGNKNFDDANFEAFVGNIKKNKFEYGTYLIKTEDDYYLYHGKIDAEGKKNDNNAFCYSSKMDRLIKGKIKDDIFQAGYIAFYNSDTGEMDDINYVEFEGKSHIKKLEKRNKIEKSTLKSIENELNNFRDKILEKDYFGILYNKFEDAVAFAENGVRGLESFENKDKMNRIISLCDSFKTDNVYEDIEKEMK